MKSNNNDYNNDECKENEDALNYLENLLECLLINYFNFLLNFLNDTKNNTNNNTKNNTNLNNTKNNNTIIELNNNIYYKIINLKITLKLIIYNTKNNKINELQKYLINNLENNLILPKTFYFFIYNLINDILFIKFYLKYNLENLIYKMDYLDIYNYYLNIRFKIINKLLNKNGNVDLFKIINKQEKLFLNNKLNNFNNELNTLQKNLQKNLENTLQKNKMENKEKIPKIEVLNITKKEKNKKVNELYDYISKKRHVNSNYKYLSIFNSLNNTTTLHYNNIDNNTTILNNKNKPNIVMNDQIYKNYLLLKNRLLYSLQNNNNNLNNNELLILQMIRYLLPYINN
ncbi:hypothetical protein ABK040_006265 [Willaertia magna]